MGVAGTSPGAHEAVSLHAAQQVAAQQAQHGLVGPLPALPALPHAQGPVQLLPAHSCQRTGCGVEHLDEHEVIMPAGHVYIRSVRMCTQHKISLAPTCAILLPATMRCCLLACLLASHTISVLLAKEHVQGPSNVRDRSSGEYQLLAPRMLASAAVRGPAELQL